MGQLSRLDAVNSCLLAAGEAIVSDLENQSGVDTSIAEYLLDSYTQDYQMRGLANNEYLATLAINEETGKILLPNTIISLDFRTALYSEDNILIRVSIKKEGDSYFLWNVTEQTSDWSSFNTGNQDIQAVLIVEIPWEDIDTPGQRGIVASAARRYQMLTQGDGDMDMYLQQDEMMYNFKGKARDAESKARSIWDASSYQTSRAVIRPSGNTPNFRNWRARGS